jgi:hypothetical protein
MFILKAPLRYLWNSMSHRSHLASVADFHASIYPSDSFVRLLIGQQFRDANAPTNDEPHLAPGWDAFKPQG